MNDVIDFLKGFYEPIAFSVFLAGLIGIAVLVTELWERGIKALRRYLRMKLEE